VNESHGRDLARRDRATFVAGAAPIIALVFGVPAAVALAVCWTLHG